MCVCVCVSVHVCAWKGIGESVCPKGEIAEGSGIAYRCVASIGESMCPSSMCVCMCAAFKVLLMCLLVSRVCVCVCEFCAHIWCRYA